MSAAGLSMWPLVLSGDSLRVVRCAAADLSPGDIAIFRYQDPRLVAHLVASTEPFRTTTSVGTFDPPAAVVLGRVIAVRRLGVTVPLPPQLRHLLRHAPSAARALKRIPGLLHLVRALRD